MEGNIVKGSQIARSLLGIPTANIKLQNESEFIDEYLINDGNLPGI